MNKSHNVPESLESGFGSAGKLAFGSCGGKYKQKHNL